MEAGFAAAHVTRSSALPRVSCFATAARASHVRDVINTSPSRHCVSHRTAGLRCPYLRQPSTATAAAAADDAADSWPAPEVAKAPETKTASVVASVVGVLLLGVVNRVLYRMTLVPMQNYIVYLAQVQNIAYIAVYFGILALRYRAGHVTDAMLALPKGASSSRAAAKPSHRLWLLRVQVMLAYGASQLPGVLLPILAQSYLVWNLLWNRLILRTRFKTEQLLGAAAVLAGVIWTNLPAAGATVDSVVPAGSRTALALVLLSFAFPALAFNIKELLFKDAQQRLGGRPLDVIVVNAFGSAAQTVYVLLLLPLILAFKGMSLRDLPAYIQQGTTCFMGGAPACGADCSGSPLIPLLYITVNIAFNISSLYLLRTLGSVTSALSLSALIPLTVIAFSLPLPYLERVQLTLNFAYGTALVVAGLLVYNYPALRAKLAERKSEKRA